VEQRIRVAVIHFGAEGTVTDNSCNHDCNQGDRESDEAQSRDLQNPVLRRRKLGKAYADRAPLSRNRRVCCLTRPLWIWVARSFERNSGDQGMTTCRSPVRFLAALPFLLELHPGRARRMISLDTIYDICRNCKDRSHSDAKCSTDQV
jgi:hypothetical protein